ncbi:MAG: phospholipase D-like domain-containing anti-phage protein [Spirochaetia bacterium]|jgi:superfamily II DNA or RNA helicase
MIRRHAFQRARVESGRSFLAERLVGAVAYDRIAGYFDSSLLELAGEALEGVRGTIRVVCNSDIRAADLVAAEQAQKLSFFKNDPESVVRRGTDRLSRLLRLISGEGGAKLDVRVLPDEAFGLIHGKAGVIRYADGRRTSFLGSANETYSGWALNYELVWEDDSEEACDWVQAEFCRLWSHSLARPLAQAVVTEVERLSRRVEKGLETWAGTPVPDPASVAVEAPVFRQDFGLWPHQKYFVQVAWRAHRAYGARFLLADQVGLGKTLQLGMVAQLAALTSEKPVLALLPKTLLQQWQTELWDLLQVPTARWDGSRWVDESGFEHPANGKNPLLSCPRRIGLVSQGLVVRRSEVAIGLLDMEWSCVIVDEAHHARRRKLPKPDERGPRISNPDTEANNLYAFVFRLARQTESMLLATATPVQLHPIEVWDLLRLLAEGNDHVLGCIGSRWLDPEDSLPYVLGEAEPPSDPETLWPWLKNPLPPSWEEPSLRALRQGLGLSEQEAVAPLAYQDLKPLARTRANGLCGRLFESHSPFLRTIVRRTRSYLETTIDPATREPYLRPVAVELFGENDPVPLAGYLATAYERAEEFCQMLGRRVRSSGFMKTLLLRRIGSSMEAGRSTVTRMLQDWDRILSADSLEEDEENEAGLEDERGAAGEIRTLTPQEVEKLEACRSALETNQEEDPKWQVILRHLRGEGWADDGCILFSQYLDTASWVARGLAQEFPDRIVAVYAGSERSGIWEAGSFRSKDRDDIKRLVKEGIVTLLVGTDAASEGLNLQRLGTLINIDLPWNPTRLEQRKGRIQRIGQPRPRVRVLNLRYRGSVEDKVHDVLAGRLEEIFKMFGQIPDVLEDMWVDVALGSVEEAERRIGELSYKHPFDERYGRIEQIAGWEQCAEVVNARERMDALRKGWGR